MEDNGELKFHWVTMKIKQHSACHTPNNSFSPTSTTEASEDGEKWESPEMFCMNTLLVQVNPSHLFNQGPTLCLESVSPWQGI